MNYESLYHEFNKEDIDTENKLTQEEWQYFCEKYCVFFQQEANEIATDMLNDYIYSRQQDSKDSKDSKKQK